MKLIDHANVILNLLTSRRGADDRIAPVSNVNLLVATGQKPPDFAVVYGQASSLLDVSSLESGLPLIGRLVTFDREDESGAWTNWKPFRSLLFDSAPRLKPWSDQDIALIRNNLKPGSPSTLWRGMEADSKMWLHKALLAAQTAVRQHVEQCVPDLDAELHTTRSEKGPLNVASAKPVVEPVNTQLELTPNLEVQKMLRERAPFERATAERVWVGPDYPKQKIFVLGESWYGEYEGDLETDDGYIRAYLDNKLSDAMYTRMANACGLSRHQFWQSVMFTNFVQRVGKTRESRPTPLHYEAAGERLARILAENAPRGVWILGMEQARHSAQIVERAGIPYEITAHPTSYGLTNAKLGSSWDALVERARQWTPKG